jgi:hypothetical protein
MIHPFIRLARKIDQVSGAFCLKVAGCQQEEQAEEDRAESKSDSSRDMTMVGSPNNHHPTHTALCSIKVPSRRQPKLPCTPIPTSEEHRRNPEVT